MSRGPFRPYAGGPLVWPDETPDPRPLHNAKAEQSEHERNLSLARRRRDLGRRRAMARDLGIDVEDVPEPWECDLDEREAAARRRHAARGDW